MTWKSDDIPDELLRAKNTTHLIEWLRYRGLQMTLLELDSERQRRGIKPPMRPGKRK